MALANRATVPNYDYGYERAAIPRPAYYPEQEEEAYPRTVSLPEPQRNSREQAKPKSGISGFAIFGYLTIGALVIAILFAHVQVVMLSSQATQLETELNRLQLEGARLLADHELAFAGMNIVQIAEEELGMIRAQEGDWVILQQTAEDRAMILQMEIAEDYGFLSHLAEIFGSLRGIFTF